MSLVTLAHQGGWDEALMVAAPVIVLAGIVWNAKRRSTQEGDGDPDAASSQRPPDASTGPAPVTPD